MTKPTMTPDLPKQLRQQRTAVEVFREVLASNVICRPALRGALKQLLRELEAEPSHRGLVAACSSHVGVPTANIHLQHGIHQKRAARGGR